MLVRCAGGVLVRQGAAYLLLLKVQDLDLRLRGCSLERLVALFEDGIALLHKAVGTQWHMLLVSLSPPYPTPSPLVPFK